MVAQVPLTPGYDFLLVRLCQAAAHIDRIADNLAAGVDDVLPSDPVYKAAFARIDLLMANWHAIRIIVAGLPANTCRAVRARAKLLGPDEQNALTFSASLLPQGLRDLLHAQCDRVSREKPDSNCFATGSVPL